MLDKIKNIEFLNNSLSASPTNVYFADIYSKKVAIKAFLINPEFNILNPLKDDFNIYKENISGLLYECEIYKKLITSYSKSYTPHFIEYVNILDINFEEFIDLLFENDINKPLISKKLYKESILENFKQYTKLFHDSINVNPQTILLITKKYNNFTTFQKILESSEISVEDITKIMFQLIYTLSVMEKLKLQHNDLHCENILIIINDSPVTYYYNMGDIYFKITSIYTLKIFDWDLSFSPFIGINNNIDSKYWEEVGILNKFKSKFDLFTVMCYMKSINTKKKSLNTCFILSSIFNINIFKDEYKLLGGPVEDLWLDGVQCRAKYDIPDSLLNKPLDILNKNPIFDIFRIDKSDINESEKIYYIPYIF